MPAELKKYDPQTVTKALKHRPGVMLDGDHDVSLDLFLSVRNVLAKIRAQRAAPKAALTTANDLLSHRVTALC